MDIKILTQEAMTILPEKIRDIVYKRYWLGMTSKEIGDSLSLPPSTVRYHLSSAISLLKNKYKFNED
jgi:RNA polymerase sigma-70 factor (ECF subfamily)